MRNSLKTLAALILALAAFAAFAPKEWRVVAEAAAVNPRVRCQCMVSSHPRPMA